MPINHAIKLISHAKKKEDKEYLFRHYLMIYPNMDKKTYKSFEDYYEENTRIQNVKYDNRNIDELMEDILNIQV